MKKHQLIPSIALALLVAGFAGCATDAQKKSEQAKLEAQAKVSHAEAEKIALAKVPAGTIKEGEIEREDGRLVWSFDIATPGSKDVTEVLVDANTGAVVSVENETAEHEAKEKADEKRKEKSEDKN